MPEDFLDLADADIGPIEQYLADKAVLHSPKFLIQLDRHCLVELIWRYEAHLYSGKAKTLIKPVV